MVAMRINLREPTIDTNLPLTDGTVTIDGFDLRFVDGEADVWDQGFGALVPAMLDNAPWICIPAFPNRKFRQSYIQVRTDAGIGEPKDLEGRRVGILKWDNTAGIWARGALQNHYGVDLSALEWFSAKDATTAHYAGCVVRPLPGPGGDADSRLNALLLAGELDAVISPNVLESVSRRDGRARRLFEDYKGVEQAYFRETGIFPISHVVTLRAEFVADHPEAPVALLEAYRRARDVAFERIEGSDPCVLTVSWAAAAMQEQRAVMGENYWPYNLEDNRIALEAMVDFSYQQGVIAKKLDYESFFDPAAAALVGQ